MVVTLNPDLPKDCVCIFGGSGEPGKTASKNYAIVPYRGSTRR
jgi:hypothetical protein